MKTVPLWTGMRGLKLKGIWLCLVVYTRCFWIDRATRCLSLPFVLSFSHSLPPLLSLSWLPPLFLVPFALYLSSTHALSPSSLFPLSLSLSLCVRVSTSSSYWFRQGSCVRNGNYFLKRNKMESRSPFDYVCTNSNVRYFLTIFFHVRYIKFSFT